MNPAPMPTGDPINVSVVGDAFNVLKDKWQNFVIGGLLYIVAVGVVTGILYFVLLASLIASGKLGIFLMLPMMALMIVLSSAVGSIFQAGMVNMALKAVNNEPFDLQDLWWGTKNIGPTVVAGIIMGLAIGIGMMFCYIPGIIIGGLSMLTFPLIIRRGMAPMDAFKKSIDLTKPYLLMAAVTFFVLALVAGLGEIACGIGIIFTMPILFIGQALIFQQFERRGAV